MIKTSKNAISRDKLSDLQAGDVIAIRYPLYKHFAIVSDQNNEFLGINYPNLISLSNRTGTVLEESWHLVVGNKPVEKTRISGNEPRQVILNRAREAIEMNIKYELLSFNCEHFVRYVHGLPIKSIQVRKTFYGAAIGAASCMLLPKVTAMRIAIATTSGAITSLKGSLNKL